MAEDYPLGKVLRDAREKRQLGVRELSRLIARTPNAGVEVSPSYYAQVEGGYYKKPSMDALWAIGVVLGLDPLRLFVISRPNIPQHLAEAGRRKFLFDGTDETEAG